MPFTGIYGLPGKGKSLFQLQYGLRLAEQYKMRIVSNFWIHPYSLAYYCKVHNLTWLQDNIDKGIICYVSATKNFSQFLQIRQAVILLDEMGLYAPSAEFWQLPPEAHNAIANNRKMRQHIVYCAQYPSQVNSRIHDVCTDIIYCEGQSIWSQELEADKLIFKDTHAFDPPQFQVWFRDPKLRKNPIKVWVLAKKHWKGLVSSSDVLTFKCYDSFALIEQQDSAYQPFEGFGYRPYIYLESSEQNCEDILKDDKFSSWTLKDIDSLIEGIATTKQSNKKRRIADASKDVPPFLMWKLEGELSSPLSFKSHRFTKHLIFFWENFPAFYYPKLKQLDFWLTRECAAWDKTPKETRDLLILMFRIFVGVVAFHVIFTFIKFIFVRR